MRKINIVINFTHTFFFSTKFRVCFNWISCAWECSIPGGNINFRSGNPIFQTRTRCGRAVKFTTYFVPVLKEESYIQSSYWPPLPHYNTSRNQHVYLVEIYVGWKLVFDSARLKLFSKLFVEVFGGALLKTCVRVS